MSANWKQVYEANPTTTFNSDDIFYLARAPYGAGDDFGFTYSSLAAQFAPLNNPVFTGTVSADNFVPRIVKIISNNGTVNFTKLSVPVVYIVGTATLNIVLPDATTLTEGWTFYFINQSTGIVTVKTHGGATLFTMQSGSTVKIICEVISPAAGVWTYSWSMPQSAVYGTAGLSVTGTLSATGNVSGHNFLEGYTSTATTGGTTTLTSTSAGLQYFTGSTTQTVVLPVVSTLVLGQQYQITNRSSGNVTVESSGANTIQVMAPSTKLIVTCISLTGTSASSWDAHYTTENNEGTVTSVAMTVPSIFSISGSPITSAGTFAVTYSGIPLPLLNGGTAADLSGTGGTGQVLKQVTSGAPITVAELAASELSNGVTGTGEVVLNNTPSITNAILNGAAGGPTTGGNISFPDLFEGGIFWTNGDGFLTQTSLLAGQVPIGGTSGGHKTVNAGYITGGTGIEVDSSSGAILVSTTGADLVVSVTDAVIITNLDVGLVYVINSSTTRTLPLPLTANVGDWFQITGWSTGGWSVTCNTGQTIYQNALSTITSTGSISSTNGRNCVKIRCVVANTTWVVENYSGTLTII